jgi:MtaA/CmuA family methyltransferase
MNSRDRLFALLDGRPVDRIPLMPITMMFAADLIGASYLQYATDYRVLVEGQIRTAERFGCDFVSCISDPAREGGDLGAPVRFFDDMPPAFIDSDALLADKTALARLSVPDPLSGKRMLDRVKAAALMKEKAGNDLIVEGWIEGPFATAVDLRGAGAVMFDLYDDPAFVSDLMAFAVEVAIAFARAQRDAGVDLMGVGDAASSLVSAPVFSKMILPHHVRLVEALKAMGLRTRSHICGNTTRISAARAGIGYDIIDIDSQVPMEVARSKMGPDAVILGNIPTVEVMLQGAPELVRSTAAECCRQCGPKHILSAGCEVPRGTPAENMDALRDFAFSLGRAGVA